VTAPEHVVIEAGHPSPMNPRGFRGTRPFSSGNAALVEAGISPIDWSAPGLL
jgi:uracil-DNA glycosylase